MELEVREAPQDQREKLRTRVKSYEVELKRLQVEFERAKKLSINKEGTSSSFVIIIYVIYLLV